MASSLDRLKTYISQPHTNTNLGTAVQVGAFIKGENPTAFDADSKQEAASLASLEFTVKKSNAEKGQTELVNEWYQLSKKYQTSSSWYELYRPIPYLVDLTGALPAGKAAKVLGVSALTHGIGLNWETKLEQDKAAIDQLETALIKSLRFDATEWLNFQASSLDEKKTMVDQKIANYPLWQEAAGKGSAQFDAARPEFSLRIAQKLAAQPQPPVAEPSQLTASLIKKGVEAADHVKKTLQKWEKELSTLVQGMNDTRDDLSQIKQYLGQVGQDSAEGLKILRFWAETQYKNLSTADKIEAIHRGIHAPKIGELETLEVLKKWEAREKALKDFSQITFQTAHIFRALGVKLPKDLEKGIVVANHGFNVAMGFTTGNPMQFLSGVSGIVDQFTHRGPDLATLRHEQLVQKLTEIGMQQEQIIAMIGGVSEQVQNLYELNLEIAKLVYDLGEITIRNHGQVMKQLYQINFDVLTVVEVVVAEGLKDIETGEELIESQQNDTRYQYHRGLFATHAAAQLFFTENLETFKRTKEACSRILKTKKVDVLLKFSSHFTTLEANPATAQSRPFYSAGQTTFGYYNTQLTAEEKKGLFPLLFEPLSTVRAWKDVPPATGASEAESIMTFCQPLLSDLIDPGTLLRVGQLVLHFHGHFPLIQDFQTGQLYSLETLLQLDHELGYQQLKGKRLLDNLLRYVNLSIAQYHLISGGPLVVHAYQNLFNDFAAHPAPASDRIVSLLAGNPLLARNAILFALSEKLGLSDPTNNKEKQCFKYRLAYNSTDSGQLKSLFPGWEFAPLPETSLEKGWQLVCPFRPIGQDQNLTIPLIQPSDLYRGQMEYPFDIYRLLDFRKQVIDELIGYSFLTSLNSKPNLKQTLAQKIMMAV